MLDTTSRCGSRVEFSAITAKYNFAVVEILEAFFARNDLAARRKDGRDAHQVLRGDTRIPKGQLKGG